jgi:transcriptional regulator with XRE-family HTH domain
MVESRRVALGLTYHQLAEASSLSYSTVYKIANGQLRTVPSPGTVKKLAEGLRIPGEILAEALLADQGLKRTEIAEGKRRTIYVTTRELTPQQLDVIQTMIDALRDRSNPSPGTDDSA